MTNIKTEIFVLCDYATISREQKLSILGIFDQFFVENIPSSWAKMFLVAVLKGEANTEYNLTLKMIPPTKTDQNFPDKQLKVTLGPNGKANLVTELVNFPLPVAGAYKIQITDKEKTVGELEFKVNKTTPTYQGQDLSGKKVSN